MGEKNNLVLVVGAIVAFVLQIALAPAVALFSAQPNFLLAYALVVAIVIPTEAGPVLPFAMGLLYDLTGTGPVGGMALDACKGRGARQSRLREPPAREVFRRQLRNPGHRENVTGRGGCGHGSK